MARKIKGNASDFHERALLALYAAVCQRDLLADGVYFIRGGGVAHILGGVWSSYRHDQMMKLQELGMVIALKAKRGREAWYYGLTNKGLARCQEIVSVSRKGLFFLSNQDAHEISEFQLSLLEKVNL